VDGVYEPKLDESIPTILSYENYICRNEANAFVSRQNGAYWVVDLGEEYLINSIIYVGVEGRYVDSINTIIELFDYTLNHVAIQVVSTYMTIFGVDILDFRVNRNKGASTPGNYLEVRPRQIAVGCSGCGLMAQYVRLKGINIRISQIIAIDSTGKNQALYMPTYTNINLADSYKLVDGKYYQKMENPIQGEREAYIMNGSGYIEVNFGQEVEIVAIFLIPTVESTNLSNSAIIGPSMAISSILPNTNLTIQIYNKFRDTIATINPTYNTKNFSDISLLSDSNSLVYPSASKIIGVNIIKKFADFKIQAGLMSADVLTGDDLPPLNFGCSTAPTSVECAQELRVIPRFTRGANGGIRTRYLRVYNVSQYVQVSQIMAYGIDGTNFAYQKKATSESIFPGTYAAKVTDGTGGYYHNARTCAESYKSEGNLYGFLEIDLWTKSNGEQVSSPNFEIVGLRCIFPSDNPGQNIGTRIHLLDENLLVLAQYVVGNGISLYNSSKYEFEDLIVDYRIQPVTIPINKIIMPKISSLTGLVSTMKSPNGIVEVGGKVYVADTLANRILVNDGTVFSSSNLLSYPIGLASDGTNIYAACYGNGTIVKIPIESPGSISVMCSIPKPYGLCLNEGTLYITSYDTNVLRYYTFTVGTSTTTTTPINIITKFAGTGTYGGYSSSQHNIQANTCPLNSPFGLAVSSTGIVYIADTDNHCIRKVETNGNITKFAGTGTYGGYSFSQNNIQANTCPLQYPTGLAVDSTGNVYIADTYNHCIRKVDTNGIIRKIAGIGTSGVYIPSLNNVQANTCALQFPQAVAVDSTGIVYIADTNNHCIRKVETNGIISLFAGTGTAGGYSPSQNYIQANTCPLQYPTGLAVDSTGNVYIADTNNYCIRKVTPGGIISLFAGTETYGDYNPSQDNIQANTCPLQFPTGLTVDSIGNLYIADTDNHCIRKVTPGGIISLFAGTGAAGEYSPSQNNIQANTCPLENPYGVAVDSIGNFYIADTFNQCIRRVSIPITIAATSVPISLGINYSSSIAHIGPNTLLISSVNDKCVYRVNATSGVTTKYIGSTGGTISLTLSAPSAISYDKNTKILFISDYVQDRIYSVRMDPLKPFETENIAGNGKGGYSGDGAQGSLARFDGPMNLLYSPNTGYLYVSDYNNKRVRTLNLYSQPAETIASTTTSPQWIDWTTTTLSAQTLTQDTLTPSQYVEAAVAPTDFSTITSPSKITDIQSVAGITTYYFFNNTHYYCANGNVYTIGNATPIRSGLGTCHMTMDNGFIFLCDTVNRCIWKENSAGSRTFSKYIGASGAQITYSFVNIGYIGFDKRRRLYVVDGDSILRMNKFNNGLEKYVGGAAQVYSTPDYGTKIKLDSPGAFAFDSQNNLIFIDYTQETVFKVADTNGMVQHICRSPSLTKIYVDQLKAESIFPVAIASNYNIRTAFGVTVDSADNIYVTSTNGQQILKLIPNNTGTYSIDIVAGLGSVLNDFATNTGAQDILGKYAQLNNPTYIYSTQSEIYFSELVGKIRKITLQTQTSQPITTILPYGPLSIVANYSRNTYNTTALPVYSVTPTAIPIGSVGRIDGPWVSDSGNITHVVLDEANQNIIFLGVANTGDIRVIDLKGKGGFYSGTMSDFMLTKWYNNDVMFNIQDKKFIYIPVDSGIYTSSAVSVRIIGTVRQDATSILFLVNYSISMLECISYNLISNVSDTSYIVYTVNLKLAFLPPSYVLAPHSSTFPRSIPNNSYTTYYNTVKNTVLTALIQTTPPLHEKTALMQNFNATSICCDTANNVYFPDTNTRTIMKMDSGGNLSIFAGPFTTAPIRIANYKDTYIYATNGVNITAYLLSTGAAQALTYTLAGCSNIAISPIGLMYVSNTANQVISIYNLKTGATAPRTLTVAEATTIDSLCVDTDLNLYVGKTHVSTYKISKYDSAEAAQGTTPDLRYKVSDIAYSSGALYYLTNINEATITTFKSSLYKINGTSMTLAPTRLIGQDKQNSQTSDGAYGNTTTLSNPLAICIDMNGNIYIVDKVGATPDKTVIVKNATFTPLQNSLAYNITGTNAQGQIIPDMSAYLENFSSIQGVCYDSVGNMYISDSGQNTISKIDLSGKLTTFAGLISTAGSYSGDDGTSALARLNNPTDIKMSKSDVLYIADTGNNAIRRVKIFDGDNFKIETHISNIQTPTALAIDSYENVYVVTGATTIAVISPITETLTMVINTGFNVSALAVNNLDQVYYTGNGALRRLGDASSTPFTQPTGLAIDASNKIYVSDSAQNRVFSVVGGTVTTEIGNGITESVVNATDRLAENIYGNGVPPLTTAITAPRALAVNPSRGLLVAQATRVLLKPATNYGTMFNCGITSGTLTIANTGTSGPLFLSQIVALNTTGTNILLRNSIASYLDGFYGCKGATSAFQIVSGTPLAIPISGTVTCILIYVGSTNKTRWNGATITFGTDVRYVKDMRDDPSVQYILLDYRTKTPACTPFINYVNKYKLQVTSSATTETFRIQYARYVRIVCTNTQMTISRIYAIHGETGQDILSGKVPYTNLSPSAGEIGTLNAYTNSGTNLNFPYSATSNTNFWIEYDLGDEYPIEQVIIQQNITSSGTYNVALYTTNRTQIQYPSTFNRLDGRFASVVVQGASSSTIIGSTVNIGASSSITVNSISYITYNVQQGNLPESITFTAVSPPPVYVMYNQAGEEITRSVLTYSPYLLPRQTLTTLSYSFAPIIGLRRIRYIRTNAAISQIFVFDSNGVNVSNGKTVISNQMDLGQEYELIQIVCTSAATSTTITFLDAFNIQQRQETITGTSINIDLRGTTRFVALPTISSQTNTDTSLTGFIRGRYVRIENTSPGVALSVTTPNIFDIHGKNLMAGKSIVTSSPPTEYGASWEIDLGQEYPIRDIVYSGPINAVAIYNRYKAESWRNYTNGPMTAPLVPLPVPNTTTGTALRYIRIIGSCTINHVAAIDVRGVDVAVWKPVRIASDMIVSYNTFNGLYASGIMAMYDSSTLAGSESYGFADGTGTNALFLNPYGLAVDASGNIFVADTSNHRIRKVTPGGVVTTLAGSGSHGFANGIGAGASFYSPMGVAVDRNGDIIVADTGNNRIRKVTNPGGVVSTLAGDGYSAPYNGRWLDGPGAGASFHHPMGVAIDSNGNVIVADTDNHRIRKVTNPGGVVTTLAGSGSAAFANNLGANASFNSPMGVAVDPSGNVIVADTGNSRIRKVTNPGGMVSTLDVGGSFNSPAGVAVDMDGNVIVADTQNHRIKKVTNPGGVVTTLAGNGAAAFAYGNNANLFSFNSPSGVAVNRSGIIIIADTQNQRIRKIEVTTTDRLEIDLGASYSINNIKVYLSTGSNPTVTAYNALGNTVTFTAITFAATIPTAIQPYPNWGIKTRYIGINTAAANAKINNLVVVDSLGRNLAQKNNAKSSNGTSISIFGNSYSSTREITLPTTYTELDLGQEHYITSVSVYSTYDTSLITGTPLSLTSLPRANTSLQGATVTLMDAYYNRIPRTLAGLGSQYNNTWPLGTSLGPYYQSPPTGVTVVPGTDGAIWSFPITEQIVGTTYTFPVSMNFVNIRGMTVSSTDVLYYTVQDNSSPANDGLWRLKPTETTPTHLVSSTNLWGVVLDISEKILYVCGGLDNRIYLYEVDTTPFRRLISLGITSTSVLDGDYPNITFKNPVAIDTDRYGNLYVCDRGNHLIRKIKASLLSFNIYANTATPDIQTYITNNATSLFKVITVAGATRVEGGSIRIRNDSTSINGGIITLPTDIANSITTAITSARAVTSIMIANPSNTSAAATAATNLATANNNVSTFLWANQSYPIDGIQNSATFDQPSSIKVISPTLLYVLERNSKSIRRIELVNVTRINQFQNPPLSRADGGTGAGGDYDVGIVSQVTNNYTGTTFYYATSLIHPSLSVNNQTNTIALTPFYETSIPIDLSVASNLKILIPLSDSGSDGSIPSVYRISSTVPSDDRVMPPPAGTTNFISTSIPLQVPNDSNNSPLNFTLPGIEYSNTNIIHNIRTRIPNNSKSGSIIKTPYGYTSWPMAHKRKSTGTNETISVMYFYDRNNRSIRRLWTPSPRRNGYCIASRTTPTPLNSFVLSKQINFNPATTDTTYTTTPTPIIFEITGNYAETTNTYLYPSGTQNNNVNNQYYTLPNKPFLGPGLPLVDPTGQHFVTATFSETLNFSPPAQPMFTITSVTNTSFVLTVTSVGSDYATSYRYSLNGGATQVLTLSGTNTATIMATAQSYNSIIVTGINGDGSTASLIRYVQLLPPAPSITLVAGSRTSTAFSISLTPVPPAGNAAYTTSYNYSLNGGGATAVPTGTTTVNITGLTAGSNPNIVVRAIYTLDAETLTSLTPVPFSIQLLPPAPSISTVSSITSTAFSISWTHVVTPGNAAYTRSYTYSLNGGGATAVPTGTTVNITGLIAGSNNSVVLRAIYTSGSETLTSLPSNTRTIQLAPPTPSLTSSNISAITTNPYNFTNTRNGRENSFTINFIVPPSPIGGYIISYTITLTNVLIWDTDINIDSMQSPNDYLMYGYAMPRDSNDTVMISAIRNNMEYDSSPGEPNGYRKVNLERIYITNYISNTYNLGDVVVHNGRGYILKATSSTSVPGSAGSPWWKFAETTKTYTSTTNSMTFGGFSLIPGINPTVTVVNNYVQGSTRVSSAPSAPLTITM
jgi:sugar lactone lactonase YvrE